MQPDSIMLAERTHGIRNLSMQIRKLGLVPQEVKDDAQVRRTLQEDHIALIVLDTQFSDENGIVLCKEIKEQYDIPIMLVSDHEDEQRIIEGFRAGADDYVLRTHTAREIALRIKAIVRRASPAAYRRYNPISDGGSIVIAGIMLDQQSRRVTTLTGQELSLTAKEFELLYLLASHEGTYFSREDLLHTIWKHERGKKTRTLDTHIQRLRHKLNEVSPGMEKMIITSWGLGYGIINIF